MQRMIIACLAATLALACAEQGGGGDDDTDDDQRPACADTVIDAPGHTGEGFGDSTNAANGVYGCGQACSSEDVFSLGYDDGVDNYVVLRWSDRTVLNGHGADFAVFENPFLVGGGPSCFMDQAVVQVSRDGETWVSLPHDYLNDDETAYVADPGLWQGFAGVMPVLLNEDSNPVAPHDPEAAGGDHFDLDDLPVGDPEADAIRDQGFTYLKIVTAPSLINPDTGEPFVKEEISNGADIDGVYAWYFSEE